MFFQKILRGSLFIFCVLFFSKITQSQTVIPLYEGAMPNVKQGFVPSETTEKTEQHAKYGFLVKDISVPTLTLFKPKIPNGKALIICPGGGYAVNSFENEGTKVATYFAEKGWSCFVLKYRIPNPDFVDNVESAALLDAQQALRLVRQKAKDLQFDPDKVGIMGFSAGGHLAAMAAALPPLSKNDTASIRPFFTALIYPVITFQTLDSTAKRDAWIEKLLGKTSSQDKLDRYSAEKQVTSQYPPTFIVHASDDPSVKVQHSILMYEACIKHKVPVEMHIYEGGRHAFGIKNPTTSDVWMERFENWLLNRK